MQTNKINYQRILDDKLAKILSDGKRPRLLLHACCAPCSSYVLEYLSRYFDITVYFFNPNIYPSQEYDFRARELADFLNKITFGDNIKAIIEEYNGDDFYKAVDGREGDAEGGARCRICYRQRLEATARYAADNGFDFFTTTLSVSPYKNSAWLNELGEELSGIYGVPYLVSDFKKRNGYKRSCELSVEYGLYRQNYCGCEYSMRESDMRKS